MHLQGTISPPEGHAPIAITDDLDFLMSRRFNIQLDENIFVVTNTRRFDLLEDLFYQLSGSR